MKTNRHMKAWLVLVGAVLVLHFCAGADGKSYYIDPVKGDDGNNGAEESPWRSFKNVFSYYKPEYRPAGWVELEGGDCIYLAGGTYSQTYHPGEWKKGPTGGGSFVAYFRGLKADGSNPFRIKVMPGQRAVLDPGGRGFGLSIFQSSNWQVEGIEVTNAYGRGISLNESKEIRVSNVKIHDTDGVDNNNIAGLYITDCWNVEVHDCVFNDNYDRTCADTGGKATENSTNVVIFGGMHGGNITIRNCLIYQSPALSEERSGGGIKYKHASRVPGAYFRVYENVFKNCKFFAFGSGTANTHFHHNIIVGGEGISSRDFGGVTHQANQIFEYNTIYNASGFHMNPTIRWRNEQFPDDPIKVVFRNNIVVDSTRKYSAERGIVAIGTYMSDELYEIITGQLTFANNCYFNPNGPVQFNLAAGFNYKDGYRAGGTCLLKEWQKKHGYDIDSLETDPLFVDPDKGDFVTRPNSPCRNMGRYGGMEK